MRIMIDIDNISWKEIQVVKFHDPDSMNWYQKQIANGTLFPKGHGRLIDADKCLEVAWQNFYKQEDEHEHNIEDYDILRDRFYEQAGFECCQQVIVNAPTIIEADKGDNHAISD